MKITIKKLILRSSCFIIFLLLNTSCSSYKSNNHILDNLNLPESFSITNSSNYALEINKEWWHAINSDELNKLILKAFKNNPSLEQSWARLNQANTVALKKGASIYPSIDVGLDIIDQSSRNSQFNSNNWSSGIVSNYELDFWGKLYSIRSSAKLDALSARYAYETAAITLSAEVALRWNNLIASKMEIKVLKKQLKANQTSQELIELRFKNSLATALDVFQQKQAVESIAALIPIAERKKRIASLELSALLGEINGQEISSSSFPKIDPVPQLGLPIDVISSRPDIKQAAANLESADWLMNAAKMDRLPTIRLTGNYKSDGETASGLFDNWISSLAGNLILPIFDGKQRRLEQERTEAIVLEKLSLYKQKTLRAIEEIETALTLEQTQSEYNEALNIQFKAARNAYNEAISRYRNGAVEYTTVLFQLNLLQQLERSVISANSNLLSYRIALHRAIGGNWMKELKLEDEYEKN